MKKFFDHVYSPGLSFVCEKCGDETALQSFRIENAWNPCATRRELAKLHKLAGAETEFLEPLYREHDGIALYQNGDTTGVLFSPISELSEINTVWKDWFVDIAPSELRDFENRGFAFGEICHSGNYFVILEGRIYYADHDGGASEPLADNLTDFLNLIVDDPARFLNDLGCYTRYFADGDADTQWIPKDFVLG